MRKDEIKQFIVSVEVKNFFEFRIQLQLLQVGGGGGGPSLAASVNVFVAVINTSRTIPYLEDRRVQEGMNAGVKGQGPWEPITAP